MMKKTTLEGFYDLILVYKALVLYKIGQKEEALGIYFSIKPRKNFVRTLEIDCWIYVNQIFPDSVLYKYDF